MDQPNQNPPNQNQPNQYPPGFLQPPPPPAAPFGFSNPNDPNNDVASIRGSEMPYPERPSQQSQLLPDEADDTGLEDDTGLGENNLADLIFNAEIVDEIKVAEREAVRLGADTEQKATIEDLGSVLLHPEQIPLDSKREFARNLYKSFRTCQRFMSGLGRFPIVTYVNDDRSIVFEYNWHSCKGVIFFVTFSLLMLLTVLSTINIVSTMLNFPNQPDSLKTTWDLKVDFSKKDISAFQYEPIFWFTPKEGYPRWATAIGKEVKTKDSKTLRAEEMFIFRRNLASLLIVLFLLLTILTSDWNLYQRRHFVANYLTHWTESVEIMKIDAAGDAKKFSKKFLLYYIFWFFIFLAVLASNVAPVASGAPVSFTFLWVRCMYPPIHAVEDLVISILRGVGGFVYLYIILVSKVYVFFFLYICKILTTACTVWNERLEQVFTQEERKKTRKEKCASRTGFDHLFRDYVNLLDLLSGADTLFTNIIESYFSMTLISIVFEVYYLTRPVSENQTEFGQARTLDMGVILIYLFNSLMVFYLVSTGAAEVGEASANGLEIIRRQGILGHRSDSEMHFMISLYMSYTGHFDTALSGGGYFILDKTFFVAIAGTMISYIIIIFQFQPALGLSDRDQKSILGLENPNNLASLVMHVENTFWYRPQRPPVS